MVWLRNGERNLKIIFIRLDRVDEHDGQTDGRRDGGTDGHIPWHRPRLCIAWRGKNRNSNNN